MVHQVTDFYFGRRVLKDATQMIFKIDHAKERKKDPAIPQLLGQPEVEINYFCLRDGGGHYRRIVSSGPSSDWFHYGVKLYWDDKNWIWCDHIVFKDDESELGEDGYLEICEKINGVFTTRKISHEYLVIKPEIFGVILN